MPVASFQWIRPFAVVSLLSFAVLPGGPAWGDETPKTTPKPEEQIALGKALFEREWTSPAPKGSTGDGLGPMFNDVSCKACHSLGGIGGGGPAAKNVQLVSLVRPNATTNTIRLNTFIKNAQRIHPQFRADQTSLVLHRFGRAADGTLDESEKWRLVSGNELAPLLEVDGTLDEYEKWRSALLGEAEWEHLPAAKTSDRISVAELQALLAKSREAAPRLPLDSRRKIGGIWIQVTQRNPTALFGAGLIDSIPDAALIEAAEQQRKRFRGIAGRVPQASSGAVGRFGWRGQTATLRDFVFQACAIELGLQVPGHRQVEYTLSAKSESTVKGSLNAAGSKGHNDLSEAQCDAMTAFVASLPAPQPVRHAHLEHAKAVHRGEQLFEEIGCAVCHMRQLGPVEGIYSDLLLHDMGPDLADPVAAVPEITIQVEHFTGGYFGTSTFERNLAKVTTNIRQEWRTPPLWGVRDSAPYLHDGRAANLEEAIRLHGGEGERSGRAFALLNPEDRANVIRFLESFAAPGGKPSSS